MKYIFLFLMTLTLISCAKNEQKHIMQNLSESQTIVLKSPEKKSIHALKIHATGALTGEANISLMLNGKAYKTETVTGNIDFTWANDWYTDQATIRYETNNVTDGNLAFSYVFNQPK